MSSTITRCGLDDSAHLAELIARAFVDNPVVGWLAADMRDDVDRHRLFSDYFEIFVDHGVREGEVESTADGAAVAVWLLPDSGPPPDYDDRLSAIVGPHVGRFDTLDAAMHLAHPGGDHHHLAFLAVEPESQGNGHGTALLHHRHQQLDQLGSPAYLEASAPRNRALYERLGYQRTAASIDLPGGPSMWPMIKPSAMRPPA